MHQGKQQQQPVQGQLYGGVGMQNLSDEGRQGMDANIRHEVQPLSLLGPQQQYVQPEGSGVPLYSQGQPPSQPLNFSPVPGNNEEQEKQEQEKVRKKEEDQKKLEEKEKRDDGRDQRHIIGGAPEPIREGYMGDVEEGEGSHSHVEEVNIWEFLVDDDFEGIEIQPSVIPEMSDVHKFNINDSSDDKIESDLDKLSNNFRGLDSKTDPFTTVKSVQLLKSLIYKKNKEDLISIINDMKKEHKYNVGDKPVLLERLSVFLNSPPAAFIGKYSVVLKRSKEFLIRCAVDAEMGTNMSDQEFYGNLKNLCGDIHAVKYSITHSAGLSQEEKEEELKKIKEIQFRYISNDFLRKFVEKYLEHYKDQAAHMPKVVAFFENVSQKALERASKKKVENIGGGRPYTAEVLKKLDELNAVLSQPDMFLDKDLPKSCLDKVKKLAQHYLDDGGRILKEKGIWEFSRMSSQGTKDITRYKPVHGFLSVLCEVMEIQNKDYRGPQKRISTVDGKRKEYHEERMKGVIIGDGGTNAGAQEFRLVMDSWKHHWTGGGTPENNYFNIAHNTYSILKIDAITLGKMIHNHHNGMPLDAKATYSYNRNVWLQIINLLGEKNKGIIRFYKDELLKKLEGGQGRGYDKATLELYDKLYRHCGFSKEKMNKVLDSEGF